MFESPLIGINGKLDILMYDNKYEFYLIFEYKIGKRI